MAGDDRKCVAAGCNDYLCKPVDRQKLIETLSSFLPGDVEGTTSDLDVTLPNAESTQPGASPEPLRVPLHEPNQEDIDRGLIDWDQLVARLGDEALIRDIVPIFLSDTQTQFAMLATAMQAGETNEVERYAHAIKGAAANIGAQALSEMAYRLECAGRDQALAEMASLHEELFAGFDKLQGFLSRPDWMDMAKRQQRTTNEGIAAPAAH
jgi:HPt (histidine-containing phosphotransfer) domain-containing protein